MSGIVAFDADVLIYAGVADHELGARVAPVLDDSSTVRVGSVLLLPELLAEPLRTSPDSDEVATLITILARLDLQPLDRTTAQLALVLATSYRLRATDAVHLATAVAVGADRFITNNRKDFPADITEIDIVYPSDLPDPATPDGQ